MIRHSTYPAASRVRTPDGTGVVIGSTRDGGIIVALDADISRVGLHAAKGRPDPTPAENIAAHRTYSDADLSRLGTGRTPAEDAAALELFLTTHTDEALHGRAIAVRRARARAKRPTAGGPRKLADKTAQRIARENWELYGRGPYPGTPAEQEAAG